MFSAFFIIINRQSEEYSSVRIKKGDGKMKEPKKVTRLLNEKREFRNAVKTGIIQQLYKEDYLTQAQYSKLLKRTKRFN